MCARYVYNKDKVKLRRASAGITGRFGSDKTWPDC